MFQGVVNWLNAERLNQTLKKGMLDLLTNNINKEREMFQEHSVQR